MNTLAMENRTSPTLFHSNPVLSHLSRVTERADGDTATYAGIASKTAFFLLITAGLWLPLLCCYQIIYPRLDETFQIEKKISSKKEQSSRKQKA